MDNIFILLLFIYLFGFTVNFNSGNPDIPFSSKYNFD